MSILSFLNNLTEDKQTNKKKKKKSEEVKKTFLSFQLCWQVCSILKLSFSLKQQKTETKRLNERFHMHNTCHWIKVFFFLSFVTFSGSCAEFVVIPLAFTVNEDISK